MRSTVKKLPKSEVELEIKVLAEEFSRFIEQATLNLGRDLEIKGFRKGKVPKEIIEKQIGQEKILIEAADLAIKENYRKAVLENKIEAIFQPEIEIKKLAKGNDLVFLAKTAVLPEVKLPDYRKIASKIKRNKVVVEEKEIEDALSWLQKSRAKFTLKNQAAQKGDFVKIEYSLPQAEARKDAFILGEGRFIPGLEEKLIGMRIGEEKDGISLNISGKDITLKAKLISVQNVELPEINDSFVRSLGKFENIEALKENIKQGISLEKKQAESQRVRQEILEKISQASKSEIPEILIDQEQKQMVEDLKKNVEENLKISWKDYLGKIYPVKSASGGVPLSAGQFNRVKKTEKEILDSFLPQVQKRVKNFLVLREIGKREKIEVSEEEIKEEVNKILKHYPNVEKTEERLDPVKSPRGGISPEAKLFNGVDPEKLKEYTKEALKTEKTFQALESFASKF